MNELILPHDITNEEVEFLELVKRKMLAKLNDRQKFIFVYCFELGHKQYEAADVLGIHETNVSLVITQIQQNLSSFHPKIQEKLQNKS